MKLTKLKTVLAAALFAVGFSSFAAEPEAVQLWADGPYFATCNVGAEKPTDYGWHFWWGDTVGYTNNCAIVETDKAWVSVVDGTTSIKFSNSDPANSTYDKDVDSLKSEGWIDDSGNLVAAHDAATKYLGAPWRMMTDEELQKLADQSVCKREWKENYNGTGVKGYLVTSATGYTDKSIFFPAAGRASGSSSDAGSYGYCWSSTPRSDNSNSARYLYLSSSSFSASSCNRYYGMPVRAVKDPPPSEMVETEIGKDGPKTFQLGPMEGSEGNPWKVGGTDGTDDIVEAWTNGTELVIGGAGSVTNLTAIPTDVKGGIASIAVASNGVVGAEAEAFAGLGTAKRIALTLPDGWQGAFPTNAEGEVAREGRWYGAEVALTAFPLTVQNVRAQQRWPWNGKVDVLCDMTGPAGAKDAVVTVNDGEKALANFTAAVTIPESGVLATNFVWDAMTAGLGDDFKSDDVTVEVAIAEPPPLGGVQLWNGGPYWATVNLGESDDAGHPEYGALYKFDDADTAVKSLLGQEWRLPTKEDFQNLLKDENCSKQWTQQGGVNGYLFTGKDDYSSNSIFLPAAGYDPVETGDGRLYAEDYGDYWSSEVNDRSDGYAWFLYFGDNVDSGVYDTVCNDCLSVRAVRDAK